MLCLKHPESELNGPLAFTAVIKDASGGQDLLRFTSRAQMTGTGVRNRRTHSRLYIPYAEPLGIEMRVTWWSGREVRKSRKHQRTVYIYTSFQDMYMFGTRSRA